MLCYCCVEAISSIILLYSNMQIITLQLIKQEGALLASLIIYSSQ